MKLILPLFIHRNNRIPMALLCGLAFLFGYSIPNHYHLFQPKLLPLSEYDRAIPFLPWTLFIYVSEYILFVSAYFIFRTELARNRYIWAYFGTLFFSSLFFIFFPTTYPRADYPVPIDTPSWIAVLFEGFRMLDDPSNAFPSMHVSTCFLTAFAFLSRGESRLNFWIYFIWSSVVALSTLTTKQHYLVDVVSGLLVGIGAYWVFFKKVRYVAMEKFVQTFKAAVTKDSY